MAMQRFSNTSARLISALPVGLLTLVLASAALGRDGQTKEKQAVVPPALKNYRTWKCVTPGNGYPVSVPPSQELCRPVTANMEATIHGPHANYTIRVYVNKTGEKAFASAAKPQFTPGTAIIKEKYSTPTAKTPELMTVMIKRQAGFDTKNGDWEYLILSGDGRTVLESTKQHCQDCHQKVRDRGFVFRPYLPATTLR